MTSVWSTKQALVHGAVKEYAHHRAPRHTSNDKGRVVMRSSSDTYGDYVKAGDWHETREAAIEAAEKKRVAKIALLKKQIAKLEGMVFK